MLTAKALVSLYFLKQEEDLFCVSAPKVPHICEVPCKCKMVLKDSPMELIDQ